jgi:integrase
MWTTLVITAAYTGMRISELAALSRSNLHLADARLHISEPAETSNQRFGSYPGSRKAPTNRWELINKVNEHAAGLHNYVGDTGIEPVTSPV